MKVFAVNLAHQSQKKQHILEECAHHDIDVEVIKAVYGKDLSKEQIQALVQDYPDCKLTLGEIGCSLSHASIYQHMINEEIPIALILEDDAQLEDNINEVLEAIEKKEKNNSDEPRVYLLSPAQLYLEHFKTPLTKEHHLHRIILAHYTYAYVLNLAAAKALHAFIHPIRYEADRWAYFQFMGVADLCCVVPPSAKTIDGDKQASSLEQERARNYKARGDYFRQLRKKEMSVNKKLKHALWKIIGKHLVKITNNN